LKQQIHVPQKIWKNIHFLKEILKPRIHAQQIDLESTDSCSARDF
jgi:hypothetical protein